MLKWLVKLVVFFSCMLLTACISSIWTGATLLYDRHNIYIKINDVQLAANANRALFHDKLLKCSQCALELAVFNRDILLVGHVPTIALRREAYSRLVSIRGKRRVFNQLDINQLPEDRLHDSWITAKIRSHIFADANIDPSKFKIVTSGSIVYLMGDVIPKQAMRVIHMARQCIGVKRVVKLFKYYHLSDKEKA